MPSALVLRRLSKAFARREVLRDVNLDVEQGAVVGLLGANGAGKTTILEIVATLLVPTTGEAFVHGFDVVRQAAAARSAIGYCPCGSDSFYPRLTAIANLEFFAALNGLGGREGRRHAAAACDLVGINRARRLVLQQQSTGMKQRLTLARALLGNPSFLLLDEPTRSLDVQGQQAMWKLLRRTLVDELGKTVLLVSHNLSELREICDRVAILHEGRIAEVTTPAGLTPRRITDILGGAGDGNQERAHPETRMRLAR